MKATGAHAMAPIIDRGRSKVLSKGMNKVAMAPMIVLLLLLNISVSMVTVLADGPNSGPSPREISVCEGSEPPPPDQNGVRHGDWSITCPSTEPVMISRENLKIAGNITLRSQTVLRITNYTKLKQIFDEDDRFTFEIQEGAALYVESWSEVRVDRFLARPMSDLEVDRSTLTAGGLMNISCVVLKFTDSVIENKALAGPPGEKGQDAMLVISAGTATFTGSTMTTLGGAGGDGLDGKRGGRGGASIALVHTGTGVLNDAEMNISGGHGGDGMDSPSGPGTSGGMGGEALAEITTGNGIPLILDRDTISVIGGDGGKGGPGAWTMNVPAGDGGLGEVGGKATLTIQSHGLTMTDTDILVRGGGSGKGGSGGKSSNDSGGSGGTAGKGGDSVVEVGGNGDMTITGSMVMAIGGQGGDGGAYGDGQKTTGNAGNGGGGGDASMTLDIEGDLEAKEADMKAFGGHAGIGGLSELIGGDGGDGGDAMVLVNTSSSLVSHGLEGAMADIGAAGGDGGPGGDAIGVSGLGGGLNGRGGDGGSSDTRFNSPLNIDLVNTHVICTGGVGGIGGKSGSDGLAKFKVDTTYLNATDGHMDWTIEGLRANDKGVLRNVTSDGLEIAFIEEGQTGVVGEVWWDLDVKIYDMLPGETWKVTVFDGPIAAGMEVATGTIDGEDKMAHFQLLGEIITHTSTTIKNYTLMGEQPETKKETRALMVAMTQNKVVYLHPGPIDYVPHVSIDAPMDNAIHRSWKLGPCREPTPEEKAQGIEPPGCLRIEGEAWVDDKDDDGLIRDVRLTFTHDRQSVPPFTTQTSTPVHLTQPNTRRTDWYFLWEVGEFDVKANDFVWDVGEWTVEVRAYDGEMWSDDPDNYGEIVSIRMNIEHREPTASIPAIEAGKPVVTEYEYRESGVEVTFDDTLILSVDESIKIIRMEWDYDGDGVVDWSYIPHDCDFGTTCPVPLTQFIYSNEGILNAKFCVVDQLGRRKCDEKKVLINRNPEPPTTMGVSSNALLLTTIMIVCTCTVITAGLIIASLTEATKYAIMSFILIPLYTRLKKEETLDNYTRGEIRGYIVANPGAHYSRIKRDLGLNNGALIYHLRTLEREGFIYSHRDEYYRRFYPRGRKPRPGPNLTTVQESIIEILLEEPNLTVAEVAKRLEKSRKVVNYHLVWLRRWGLIESKKERRGKVYSVIYEDEVEEEQDTFNKGPLTGSGIEP